jgi:uncharacterized protein (TIGR03435 family)
MSLRVAFLLTLLVTSGGAAQAPETLKFEVASVRVNRSNAPMQATPTLQQGGRVFAINLPLRELIRTAYDLQENQLVLGSPLAEARFDVEARAGATATREQASAMLRSLLVERFALKTHAEQRELPIYRLERVNATRLGPQLRASGKECAPVTPPSGAGAPPPPPPPPPGMSGTPLGPSRAFAGCLSMFFPGGWSLRSMSMPALAMALERLVRRIVIDETGLAGVFDLDITYVPEAFEWPFVGGGIAVAAGGPSDGPGTAPPAQRSGPSLFTAIRDQLGLRLENGRAPVDVLVVDRVQPPSEN